MKFEGGYDDGYPDGDVPEGGFLDIRLQRQMTLLDFMRVVDKVSKVPFPLPPEEITERLASLVEDFRKNTENKYEFDVKKITAFTTVLMIISQRNGADLKTVASACSQYSRLLVAPRYLWGHFLLDLGNFTYGTDDLGKDFLTRKYKLPDGYWTRGDDGREASSAPTDPAKAAGLFSKLLGKKKGKKGKTEEKKEDGEDGTGPASGGERT